MRTLSGWQKGGALCFTLGGVQYLLAEKISALACIRLTTLIVKTTSAI